jgi:outer membrane lipoprotein carrier protein
MGKPYPLIVMLVLITGLNAVPAGAATEPEVERYFRDLRSLRAEFVQQVYDTQRANVQTSSGVMVMQKPGRFRWDYVLPFAQVIVADGDRLWHYDSELQQVTVRRLDQALGSTPLALLSGAAPIGETFSVGPPQREDGLQWFELKPKDEQAEFRRLRVAFGGGDLKMIELEDAFNQRTRLRFERLERNVSIDPSLLRFEPPAGVDVVGEAP